MNTARIIKYGMIAMAMAALCLLIAVPSYAAYEDSLKGYWKMDDLSADDSFSSGSLDPARWSTGGTAPYITSGSLRFVSGTAYPGDYSMASSRVNVYGNFDMQVDFDASSMPTPSSGSHITVFGIATGSSTYVVDNIKQTNGVYTYNSWASAPNAPWGTNNTNQSSGKFRIVRDGTTLYGYRWTGAAWSQYASIANVETTPAALYAYTQDYESGGQPASATFDNFTVTNGERVADATNTNPGAIYGATQTTGKTGYNTALNFDGVDDYVKLGAISGYSANTLTVSGWVNLETANRYNTIWSNYLNDSNRIYMSVSSGNNLYVYGVEEGSMAVALTDTSAFQTGVWTHVAATFDSNANVSTLYVNGAQVAAQGYSAVTVNNNIIGRYAGVSEDFDGSMDDFAIWSRALDGNEISMLYGLGTDKFEWLTLGVNDQAALNLGYTTSELKLLADLYEEGNTGMSELIDGVTWRYLSGDLPGDIGGTTYDYGDTWTYDGRSYIKLGSGLEGSPVPEPGCVFGMLAGFFVPGFRKLLKRRVRG